MWNLLFAFLLMLLKRWLENGKLGAAEKRNIAKLLAVSRSIERETGITADDSFDPMVEALKRKWR